ncbi:MAG TPA: hypothetical protein PLB55_17430 [Prosthecobacter sp.]|nr:hypothetical protein [Prosthecobacter sp.]
MAVVLTAGTEPDFVAGLATAAGFAIGWVGASFVAAALTGGVLPFGTGAFATGFFTTGLATGAFFLAADFWGRTFWAGFLGAAFLTGAGFFLGCGFFTGAALAFFFGLAGLDADFLEGADLPGFRAAGLAFPRAAFWLVLLDLLTV